VNRALVFDLDDTLYPEQRFALSGYAAVSAHLAAAYGVSRSQAFGLLRRELAAGRRAHSFQFLADLFDLPATAVLECRDIYRDHQPQLKLPTLTRTVLAAARSSWRLAVLTNGIPAIQRRKIAALGLSSMVDAVIYAHEIGDGKPDAAAFLAACSAVGVPSVASVMTGDNPWCDVDGARRAGLCAIRIRRGQHSAVTEGETGPADVTLRHIGDVPWHADRLLRARAVHAN
jgi:putative hydrolase of the HAD superfamily